MEIEEQEPPASGFQAMLDFDSMYSKGLLILSDFPRERRLQTLRLPVITATFGFCVLQCVVAYRLWKRIRKRWGGFWGLVSAGGSVALTSTLWFCIPAVREFCTLEWTLAEKYRPVVYG